MNNGKLRFTSKYKQKTAGVTVPYRVSLFGPFSVTTSDGKDATPIGRKAKALIAMLALAPHGRRARPWLQDRLWSISTGERGRASLRQELTTLRKHFEQFGSVPFVASGDDIVLTQGQVWIDVHQGNPAPHQELLEGLDINDPEFDDWLSEERAFWYGRLEDNKPAVLIIPSPEHISVAPRHVFPHLTVHPFACVGKSARLAPFADGLAEELATVLGALAGTYRIISNDFATSGSIDYIMEGGVRFDGVFRVHVRIVDISNGAQVWNGRFDTGQKVGFAEMERIARQIAESVQSALSDGEWADYWAESETTTEVWELFQKGRVQEAAARRGALVKAIAFYRAATKKDPEFLQAQISLGFCLIDGLRMCLHTNAVAAEAEAERVVADIMRLAPNNLHGRALGAFLECSQGHFATALATMQDVVERAPQSPEMLSYLGAVHGYRGDYAQEQALYRHALGLTPFPPVWIRTNLALSVLLMGGSEVESLLRPVLDEDPANPRALIAETVRLVRSRDQDAARKTASQLREIDAKFKSNEWRSVKFFADPEDQRRIALELRLAGLP